MYLFLGGRVATEIILNSYAWNICLLPFICLFNHSFVLAWTHGHLYFGLRFSAMLTIFRPNLFQVWRLGDLQVGSMSLQHILIIVSGALRYFLVVQDAPGSSYLFPAPVL